MPIGTGDIADAIPDCEARIYSPHSGKLPAYVASLDIDSIQDPSSVGGKANPVVDGQRGICPAMHFSSPDLIARIDVESTNVAPESTNQYFVTMGYTGR